MLVLAFALVALVGMGDYLAGPDVGVSLFYLVPIFLATWFAGTRGGIITSAGSAAVWFSAKWMAENEAFNPFPTLWNALIRLGFFLVIVFMQHALRTEQARARRDPLTGGSNRRHFLELAELEIMRAQRYGHPLSVAYMDLDNFKTVNDKYGHDEGDELLRLVMKVVEHNIRTMDTFARVGGDEFAFLLPETGAEAVGSVMNKIHRHLSTAMKKHHWPVTFSIGVATFAHPPKAVDDLMSIADKLMYEAKNSGKNQVKYQVF